MSKGNKHPEEVIAALQVLHARGLSASQCVPEMAKLGIIISRNGVIGIWGRNRARFAQRLNAPCRAPKRAIEVRHDVAMGTGCAWPIGDPGQPGFRFCGVARVGGARPYCPEHEQRARDPQQPKGRPGAVA